MENLQTCFPPFFVVGGSVGVGSRRRRAFSASACGPITLSHRRAPQLSEAAAATKPKAVKFSKRTGQRPPPPSDAAA